MLSKWHRSRQTQPKLIVECWAAPHQAHAHAWPNLRKEMRLPLDFILHARASNARSGRMYLDYSAG